MYTEKYLLEPLSVVMLFVLCTHFYRPYSAQLLWKDFDLMSWTVNSTSIHKNVDIDILFFKKINTILTISFAMGFELEIWFSIGCNEAFEFVHFSEKLGRTNIKFLLIWAKETITSKSAIYSHSLYKLPTYGLISCKRLNMILKNNRWK